MVGITIGEIKMEIKRCPICECRLTESMGRFENTTELSCKVCFWRGDVPTWEKLKNDN